MGEEQPDSRPGMKEFHVGEWWQPEARQGPRRILDTKHLQTMLYNIIYITCILGTGMVTSVTGNQSLEPGTTVQDKFEYML